MAELIASIVTAVLTGLVVLLGLILVGLAVPVAVTGRLDTTERPAWVVRLGWLYGLVRVRLRGPNGPSAGPPAPVDADDTRPRKRRDKPKRTRDRPGLPPRLPRGVGRLIGELLACLRIDRLSAALTVGTGDPAETGGLYGQAMAVLVATRLDRSIRLTPDFTRARLDGQGEAAVSVVPITLVPPIVRFGWTNRRLLWQLISR